MNLNKEKKKKKDKTKKQQVKKLFNKKPIIKKKKIVTSSTYLIQIVRIRAQDHVLGLGLRTRMFGDPRRDE